MADRTGVASSFGLKLETTVGTAVTVDTWHPLISEGVARVETPTESKAIRLNRRVLTTPEWNSGNVVISGPVALELNSTGLRPILALMGFAETGSGPYTYRPGDMYGKAATMQFGKPAMSGSVIPWTIAGTKLKSWEIGCAAGEIATLGLDVQNCLVDVDHSTALTAPSYDSLLRPLKFSGASVTVAGSGVTAYDMKLKGDLKLDRKPVLGSQFVKELRATDRYLFTGSILTDFDSVTFYDDYVGHTEVAIVMTFTGPNSASLVFTMNARIDPFTPNISGREAIQTEIPFTCVSSDANDYSAISAVYTVPA